MRNNRKTWPHHDLQLTRPIEPREPKFLKISPWLAKVTATFRIWATGIWITFQEAILMGYQPENAGHIDDV